MATKKVTYQCAGCGTTKEVTAEAGKPVEAPVCCGQPMREVASK